MKMRCLAYLTAVSLPTCAIAQVDFEFIDSGQSVGSGFSRNVALGDLDGDGDIDAFVGEVNRPDTIWFNEGNGTFSNSGQALGESLGTNSVALGDLDGDGDLDAFVGRWLTQSGPKADTVWFNNGSGFFTISDQILENIESVSVALADLDGDGDLDAWSSKSGYDDILLNNGNGVFTRSSQPDISLGFGVGLGDLDGDGDTDAWVLNYERSKILINDGTGYFTPTDQELGTRWSNSVTLGDIDDDGDLDAWLTANFGDPNTVWLNDGTGSFTDSGQDLVNENSQSVALGDLDSDGDLDALIGNETQDPNVVLINNGMGFFSDSKQRLGSSTTYSVALGDLDNDGDLDAWAANYGTASKVWYNEIIIDTGVCCSPCGCATMTTELSDLCEQLGGVYISDGSCDECPSKCTGDLDNNGIIDGADLSQLLSAWGLPCDE
jgi:hypothetical protein